MCACQGGLLHNRLHGETLQGLLYVLQDVRLLDTLASLELRGVGRVVFSLYVSRAKALWAVRIRRCQVPLL